eukprot:CAMPEP_0113953872 /NCGR_PEP_ID=MMETSP0011_2-20120614/97_1 /TAXON_ID=101924 /ORGANISM="Rhodosorus marinus" /LENGTH=121 /DNA_ID=CAMNT_0000962655 /DNA_START=156 /DNA_END=521 /DNA_ORIENTATION=+ /assembly_acc=CAM_ASM_000156
MKDRSEHGECFIGLCPLLPNAAVLESGLNSRGRFESIRRKRFSTVVGVTRRAFPQAFWTACVPNYCPATADAGILGRARKLLSNLAEVAIASIMADFPLFLGLFLAMCTALPLIIAFLRSR